jgi:hypothetical protein
MIPVTRTLLLAGIIAMALVAYVAGFHGAQTAFGHAVRCGGSRPPCFAKYYARQYGNAAYLHGYSHGIRGSIYWFDVNLYSTQDINFHWIDSGSSTSHAQIGLTEGGTTQGYLPSPQLYTEAFLDECTPGSRT